MGLLYVKLWRRRNLKIMGRKGGECCACVG